MTTDIIQAKYDELETLASRFGQQAENNVAMGQRVRQVMAHLHQTGWEGKGAEAFQTEMSGEVLPAFDRLTQALQQSQSVTRQMITVMRQAEEEAASVFKRGGQEFVPLTPPPIPFPLPTPTPPPAPPLVLPEQLFDLLSDQFEGILGIPDALKVLKMLGLNVPKLGRWDDLFGKVGIIWGVVSDTITNPDGDRLHSFGSSLIENLASLYPPIGVATGVSAVLQMVNEWGSAADAWVVGQLGMTPGMTADLTSLNKRFHQNVERLDVGKLTGPLADAIYDFTVTPYVDAVGDTWRNPNADNILRLGTTIVAGGFGLSGLTYNFLHSQDAQKAIGEDLKKFASNTGDFILGAADLRASSIDKSLAYGVTGIAKVTDSFPIPDNWKTQIDNGAGWVVDRIEKGIIPGVHNIPGIALI